MFFIWRYHISTEPHGCRLALVHLRCTDDTYSRYTSISIGGITGYALQPPSKSCTGHCSCHVIRGTGRVDTRLVYRQPAPPSGVTWHRTLICTFFFFVFAGLQVHNDKFGQFRMEKKSVKKKIIIPVIFRRDRIGIMSIGPRLIGSRLTSPSCH